MIRAHQKLKAWQLAMTLVGRVYRATERLPDQERYGLKSQLRRAAISVPSNIAEGAARSASRDFRRFLLVARGSLSEMETQIILRDRLGYPIEADSLLIDIERLYGLINGLIRRQRTRQAGSQ